MLQNKPPHSYRHSFSSATSVRGPVTWHWCLVLVGLASSQPLAAGVTHPISHVDAWVTVGDSLEVTLVVQLEDILRHELGPESLEQTVSADRVTQALENDIDRLLASFVIRTRSGAPFTPELVESPRWNPPASGVSPAAQAATRLRWKLRYRTAQEFDGLQFVHSFDHPTLIQPVELRLQVRAEGAARRSSVVLLPDQVHSLELPRSYNTGTPPAQETNPDDGDPNPRTVLVGDVRLMMHVSERRVLLEAVIPVTAILPLADATQQRSVAQWEATESDVLTAFLAATSLSLNSRSVEPDATACRITTLRQFRTLIESAGSDDRQVNNDPAGTALPDRPASDSIASVLVAVIRVAVRCHEEPLRAKWSVEASTRGRLATDAVVADSVESTSRLFETSARDAERQGGADPDRSSIETTDNGGVDLVWIRPRNMVPSEIRPGVSVADLPIASLRANAAAMSWRPAALVLLTLMALAAAAARSSTRRRWTTLASVAVMFAIAGAWWMSRMPSGTPSETDVTRVTQELLNTAWHAMTLSGDARSLDQLNRVFEPHLSEEIYLAMQKSLGSRNLLDERDVQLGGLQSLTCRNIQANENGSGFSADVTFSIAGTVRHWGHTHIVTQSQDVALSVAAHNGLWQFTRYDLREMGVAAGVRK